MSNIEEIEEAVRKLPADKLAAFRAWFAAYDAEQWDEQLTADASAGRLDALAEEALGELHDGRCTDL